MKKISNKTLAVYMLFIIPSFIFGSSITNSKCYFSIFMMIVCCLISGIASGIYLSRMYK